MVVAAPGKAKLSAFRANVFISISSEKDDGQMPLTPVSLSSRVIWQRDDEAQFKSFDVSAFWDSAAHIPILDSVNGKDLTHFCSSIIDVPNDDTLPKAGFSKNNTRIKPFVEGCIAGRCHKSSAAHFNWRVRHDLIRNRKQSVWTKAISSVGNAVVGSCSTTKIVRAVLFALAASKTIRVDTRWTNISFVRSVFASNLMAGWRQNTLPALIGKLWECAVPLRVHQTQGWVVDWE